MPAKTCTPAFEAEVAVGFMVDDGSVAVVVIVVEVVEVVVRVKSWLEDMVEEAPLEVVVDLPKLASLLTNT